MQCFSTAITMSSNTELLATLEACIHVKVKWINTPWKSKDHARSRIRTMCNRKAWTRLISINNLSRHDVKDFLIGFSSAITAADMSADLRVRHAQLCLKKYCTGHHGCISNRVDVPDDLWHAATISQCMGSVHSLWLRSQHVRCFHLHCRGLCDAAVDLRKGLTFFANVYDKQNVYIISRFCLIMFIIQVYSLFDHVHYKSNMI